MKSHEIRAAFIEYFRARGHEVVASSGLIPISDPTLLFTNAGMVQFKRVFLEEEKRPYKRAVTCQKCMRAGGKHNDLENVGQTARHHTFFEMLGNFSFGDYFKDDAIAFAWEFLTKEMALEKERLWVTVFETDDEAARIWQEKAGVKPERIVRLGAKDNFWAMGDTGPCGPCSEILYDQGVDVGCGRPECAVGCDCDRFLEIWNLVFMQYNRDSTGNLTPLPEQCIDTGMGLERLSAVMQGKKSNYDTDVFAPLTKFIASIAAVPYGSSTETDVSIRAIADHARAITFLMNDGVLPGNVDRGYVLRRIIRRAARHGRFIGLKEPFIYKVNNLVIEQMGVVYPDLARSKELIERATKGEEERFSETLERGLQHLDAEIDALKRHGAAVLPGRVAFKLYDTYGFPYDLTADIIKKDRFTIDEPGFTSEMNEQKKKARGSWKGAASDTLGVYKTIAETAKCEFVGYHIDAISSRILCIIKDGLSVDAAVSGGEAEIITEETPFYAESGGQVGDTGAIISKDLSVVVLDTRRPVSNVIVHRCRIEQGVVRVDDEVELVPDIKRRTSTARNHTATHLLHAALRKKLGPHLRQAGSLVAPDYLRFDFNHFEALSGSAIRDVEAYANAAVLDDIEVSTHTLAYKDALEKGALAFFGEKYGEVVRMVKAGDSSVELCGGIHVKRTGQIGLIKITSESSVASGVRRIEAVSGSAALELVAKNFEALKTSAAMLKAKPSELSDRIESLLERQKALEREIETLKNKDKAGEAVSLLDSVRVINGVKAVCVKVKDADAKTLRELSDALRVKLGSGIMILASGAGGKATLLVAVTTDLTKRFNAGEIIKRLAPMVGGKGGGKAELAQAGGPDATKIDEAIAEAWRMIEG
ncbi:MAG: alanine--tRNA ligase [Deltaproteobacteria bacterium]|nr:alanine--tRNA ligase [Deltaproteobacteria bacterium]